MSGIFISYRRDDSGGFAGRLYDRLRGHFGAEEVFRDLDAIKPGFDYAEVIDDAVGECDALIAIIGKQWATIKDQDGHRRIDDPKDFLRLEVETALRREVPVYPVLLEGAIMPPIEDLPDSLKNLARHQAIEVSDARWDHDVERLIGYLIKVDVSLDPTSATTRRQAEYRLSVTNGGNARISATLTAFDPEGQLNVSVEPPSLTIAPGETTYAAVTAKAKHSVFAGESVTHPFQVRVDPRNAPSVVVTGALVQTPAVERARSDGPVSGLNIPPWLRITGAVAGMALVVGGGIFMKSLDHFRTYMLAISAIMAMLSVIGLSMRNDLPVAIAGAIGAIGVTLAITTWIRVFPDNTPSGFFEYEASAGMYVFWAGSLMLLLAGIHKRFLPRADFLGSAHIATFGALLVLIGGVMWPSESGGIAELAPVRLIASAAIIALTILGGKLRKPQIIVAAGAAGFIGMIGFLGLIAQRNGTTMNYLLGEGYLDGGVWVMWAGTLMILIGGIRAISKKSGAPVG